MSVDASRERAIAEYRKKINEHRQIEAKLKEGLLFLFFLCYRYIILHDMLFSCSS